MTINKVSLTLVNNDKKYKKEEVKINHKLLLILMGFGLSYSITLIVPFLHTLNANCL